MLLSNLCDLNKSSFIPFHFYSLHPPIERQLEFPLTSSHLHVCDRAQCDASLHGILIGKMQPSFQDNLSVYANQDILAIVNIPPESLFW